MKTTRKTFYFDTGVNPRNCNPPQKLSKGHVLLGTIQIPFVCEVPEGAIFKFASSYPSANTGDLFMAEILEGEMQSKYAFFQI